ncbi:type IIL restriction-modification enzyme MmeI [Nannocystis sp. SCPEA4]|uniref:type IIL restriction-modification enzyme MmeI n=1 Tax=Nannocystis sp. SCPEA4 TaxID=2996787 RepID=UPI00226E8D8D|nr:type IIL restriction-modification enzyme MmeI [Nannocystis sp. SCPEA4]MCY1056693.1 hypothetical protein [Nannocystis sp. SCPEA4]
MPAPRVLVAQIAAALDAALADPSPELVRAAEHDGATAHAALLTHALLTLPAALFVEPVPDDLPDRPAAARGPPGPPDPPLQTFPAARDPPVPSDTRIFSPVASAARDPPVPSDTRVFSPVASAARDPPVSSGTLSFGASPTASALSAVRDPPVSSDARIFSPAASVALDPPVSSDTRIFSSAASAARDPPVPSDALSFDASPTASAPSAARGPPVPSGILSVPLAPPPVLSDRSPLPIEALGEAYAALAGRRIVRLDAGAVALRDLQGRAFFINLPELLAVPEALRAHHLRGLGLSREAARRCVRELSGVSDGVAARQILARARGDPSPRPGDLVFQPSPDRRRAGAYYTPRVLADVVVAAALRPLLAALGPDPTPDRLLRLQICDPAMGCGVFLLAVARRLAVHLVAAWSRAGDLPPEPHRLARRLVVERCLFGVDADPHAVALARRSLWLLFGTGDPPPEFLARAVRHGDALLGLDRDGLRAFHWKPGPVVPAIAAVVARDPELAARLGDLLVGAFMSQETDRERERERRRRLLAVEAWLARGGGEHEFPRFPVPVPLAPPLHWPLAFPRPFDAFVGNPPFLGGSQISGAFGDAYLAWLLALHPGAHGNADLCAHFLRRVDGLLAGSGTIGFIATNTIGQGDTRVTGLQALLARGHLLYEVTRDLPWPETAAVTVAIVHLARGAAAAATGPCLLHEPAGDLSPGTSGESPPAHRTRTVAAVSSHLQPGRELPDPRPLADNRRIGFAGSKVYGQGFLLTAAERAALVARDPHNARRIFPYLGGDDILQGGGPRRFVINFGACTLAEAEAHPDLLAIVRARVQPERERNAREFRRRYWWRFGEVAPGLYTALQGLERCVVNSQVGKHLVFDLVPTGYVYSHTAYVYATPAPLSLFAVLQSRVHEVWARRLASSMKTDLRYSIADCFATFPFPSPGPRVEHPLLAALGERLLAARSAALAAAPRSLTALYNALRDPREPRLADLRAAHEALDRAVLAAYEWTDLQLPAWPQQLAGAPVAAELFDRLLAVNAARAAPS